MVILRIHPSHNKVLLPQRRRPLQRVAMIRHDPLVHPSRHPLEEDAFAEQIWNSRLFEKHFHSASIVVRFENRKHGWHLVLGREAEHVFHAQGGIISGLEQHFGRARRASASHGAIDGSASPNTEHVSTVRVECVGVVSQNFGIRVSAHAAERVGVQRNHSRSLALLNVEGIAWVERVRRRGRVRPVRAEFDPWEPRRAHARSASASRSSVLGRPPEADHRVPHAGNM
mmetsp:Transcript_87970/g.250953  ORF Transcript_87970/g.250953 Transcript_87970/m.250953 type:complete len:228 (+) Transcript_87970:1550-2233(+)